MCNLHDPAASLPLRKLRTEVLWGKLCSCRDYMTDCLIK